MGHLLGRVALGRLGRLWRLQYTLILYLSFVWLFVVAMASSGLFRAGQWVVTNKEPLMITKGDGVGLELKTLPMSESMAKILEEPGDAVTVRAKVGRLRLPYSGANDERTWDLCRIMVFEDTNGTVTAVALCSRDQQDFERWGGVRFSASGAGSTFLPEELPAMLERAK